MCAGCFRFGAFLFAFRRSSCFVLRFFVVLSLFCLLPCLFFFFFFSSSFWRVRSPAILACRSLHGRVVVCLAFFFSLFFLLFLVLGALLLSSFSLLFPSSSSFFSFFFFSSLLFFFFLFLLLLFFFFSSFLFFLARFFSLISRRLSVAPSCASFLFSFPCFRLFLFFSRLFFRCRPPCRRLFSLAPVVLARCCPPGLSLCLRVAVAVRCLRHRRPYRLLPTCWDRRGLGACYHSRRCFVSSLAGSALTYAAFWLSGSSVHSFGRYSAPSLKLVRGTKRRPRRRRSGSS